MEDTWKRRSAWTRQMFWGFVNGAANATSLSPVSPLYTRAPAYSCPPGNLHLDEVCPLFSYPRESGPFPGSDPPCYISTRTQNNHKISMESPALIRWTKHTARGMPGWLLTRENSSSTTSSLHCFHFLLRWKCEIFQQERQVPNPNLSQTKNIE